MVLSGRERGIGQWYSICFKMITSDFWERCLCSNMFVYVESHKLYIGAYVSVHV